MDAKVTKLPAADRVLVGKSVKGLTTSNGDVGRYVENIIESDGKYVIDRQNAVDIPGLAVEVKSRDINSKAPHTMGTMSVENILKTPYAQSTIFHKVQIQYRVKHDGEVIKSAEINNFSEEYIQQNIAAAYEYGRTLMAEGKFDQLARGTNTRWGYWEKCGNSASYKFRIRDKMMRGMEQMQHSTYKTFFEYQ